MNKGEQQEMAALKMRLEEVTRERDELREPTAPKHKVIVNPYSDMIRNLAYPLREGDTVQYRFDSPVNRRWINVRFNALAGSIEIQASDPVSIRPVAGNCFNVNLVR